MYHDSHTTMNTYAYTNTSIVVLVDMLNFNYQNAKGSEFHPDTNYYGISFAWDSHRQIFDFRLRIEAMVGYD